MAKLSVKGPRATLQDRRNFSYYAVDVILASSRNIMRTGMFLVAVLLILCIGCSEAVNCKNVGTPSRLKEIFLGRCYLYNVNNPKGQLNDTVCPMAWDAFRSAVQGKNPADVKPDDFQAVADLISFAPIKNKGLFWSGLPASESSIVETLNVARENYTTLEYTHGGTLLNQICFCGSTTEADGWEKDSCPWEGAMKSFWFMASKTFASSVEGKFEGLFQPDPTVFGRKSMFETAEVPNLNADRISGPVTLNIVTRPEYPDEACGKGSVVDLEAAVRAAVKPGTEVRCVDDPEQLIFIVCALDENSNECKQLQERIAAEGNPVSTGTIVGMSIGFFLLGAMGLVCLVFALSRHKKSRLRRTLLQFRDDESLFGETESYVPYEDQYVAPAH